jgi:CheY-like chemotaxis protein
MTGLLSTPGLRRILYAEDDPDIQHIARFALERIGGFDVLICPTGQDALLQAEKFAPDMILLDVMLPEMDGTEILRQIRELPSLADVPTVFVTAKVQAQEIQGLLELGALDVLSKPFNPMTLAKALEALWDRHCETVNTDAHRIPQSAAPCRLEAP